MLDLTHNKKNVNETALRYNSSPIPLAKVWKGHIFVDELQERSMDNLIVYCTNWYNPMKGCGICENYDVHVPFDPASQPLKNLLPNTHEVIYVESFSSL